MESVNNNVNQVGMTDQTSCGVVTSEHKVKRTKEENGQVKNGSVFAGNINNMMNDRIAQRREMARKQATKLLMDQFNKDKEMTDRLDEARGRNQEIKDEIARLNSEKKFFREEQEALKEIYGITPDSEEQKELDLIRKAKKALRSGDWSSVSEEELEQLTQIGELTEYQERSLEYDAVMSIYDDEIRELEKEKRGNNKDIILGKQVLLKTSYKGICGARDGAEKILESASDSVKGMLWEEVKQRVDEEIEELVEEAKKRAEEKEALEEKIESGEAKKEERKEMTQEIQENASEQEQLQTEIDQILKEAEVWAEDLKGLMVDGMF